MLCAPPWLPLDRKEIVSHLRITAYRFSLDLASALLSRSVTRTFEDVAEPKTDPQILTHQGGIISKKLQAWIPIAIVVVVASTTAPTVAQLPNPGMTIDPANTALVITDPQIDFLSPDGVTWGVVGKSVEANNTVQNIETLFQVAKANGIPVAALVNFRFIASAVWTTKEVEAIVGGSQS